eukprot:8080056-Pyramimonas_sp.AAC.1
MVNPPSEETYRVQVVLRTLLGKKQRAPERVMPRRRACRPTPALTMEADELARGASRPMRAEAPRLRGRTSTAARAGPSRHSDDRHVRKVRALRECLAVHVVVDGAAKEVGNVVEPVAPPRSRRCRGGAKSMPVRAGQPDWQTEH